MRQAVKLLSGLIAVVASAGALWMAGLAPANGADHFDPPTRTDPNTTATPDVAADIADVYVFPTATGTVISVDFGGPSATTLPAFYDRDLDFNLHISNAGARTDDEFVINWRFGADPTRPNAFGIRLTGIPGTTGPIIMPVETIQTLPNGVQVHAGLIDDPFNFDAAGLRETRQTGFLSIRNDRNRFANMNSTAVTFEFPNAVIRNGTQPIAVWATTHRIRSGL